MKEKKNHRTHSPYGTIHNGRKKKSDICNMYINDSVNDTDTHPYSVIAHFRKFIARSASRQSKSIRNSVSVHHLMYAVWSPDTWTHANFASTFGSDKRVLYDVLMDESMIIIIKTRQYSERLRQKFHHSYRRVIGNSSLFKLCPECVIVTFTYLELGRYRE